MASPIMSVLGLPRIRSQWLAEAATTHPAADELGRAIQLAVWSLVLLLVFLVGSYALIRFSRRFGNYLFRKKSPPTKTEDVWKMHRLPDSTEKTD
jgi:hypothetical protein